MVVRMRLRVVCCWCPEAVPAGVAVPRAVCRGCWAAGHAQVLGVLCSEVSPARGGLADRPC